jgi:hypothetical protein
MSCRKLASMGCLLVLCMGLTTLAQGTGTIRYEVWEGIGGTAVADLTGNENFPENPSWDDELALFESPTDIMNDFGGRLYGWLHPTETADYTFWLAADDGAEVWLSTTDDPADVVLVVAEDAWGGSRDWLDRGQKSDPVSLVGGEKYYVEALYKEGGGGDNIAVAWQINADPDPNATIDPNDIIVIDGQYLSPAPQQVSLLKAKVVSPADGAVDVAADTVLEWTPGPTAIMSKVYLSTDASIDESDVIAETQDASIAPALELGQTYYWRVDAVDMAGVYEGAVATFSVIPLEAHFPGPADGVIMQGLTTQLSWTAGLDALVHNVFFSADQALVEARDPSVQVGQWLSEPAFDPGVLDYETTYYWAVDEFLGASTNPGPIWSFTTLFSIPVTDENLKGWWTFEDVEDGIVTDQSGHGNIGMLNGDAALVDVGGDTAVSFSGAGYMDVPAASWSTISAEASLAFWAYIDSATLPQNNFIFGAYSDPADNGARVFSAHLPWGSTIYFDTSGPGYDRTSQAVTTEELADAWVHWAFVKNADTGVVSIYRNGALWHSAAEKTKPMQGADVTKFTIGTKPSLAEGWFTGMMDDIRLYNKALTETEVAKIALGIADITGPDDLVVGVPNDGDWPGGETPDLAVDDNTGTKYLHFKGETEPSGIQIAPAMGASVVTGLTLTTANDAEPRDPASYELYGSNDSIDGPYELIAAGDIVDFTQEAAWPRFTMNATAILFENDVAYKYYQLMFPTVRDAGNANSMQIAEIELLGSLPPVLKVDFSRTEGPVETGFEAYIADHEQADTFTAQSYEAFGTVVTIAPSWAEDATRQAMQMIDRGANQYTGTHVDLLQDWIGTDTRQPGNPMILTISGLPAGRYAFKSYHHDNDDQSGIFEVTVNDAVGASTTVDIDATHSNPRNGDPEVALDFESIMTFSTELVSDGGTDIDLVFSQTSGTEGSDPVHLKFFLMNGFELSLADVTVVLSEDFEGLDLGPNVDEAVAGDAVWTDTPPAGWGIDESGIPGIGDPATDGVTEWAGWALADLAWWVEAAGDQDRSLFALASGTVAVADPDEWDDADHDDSAAGGWYKTFLMTPEIDISGLEAGSVQVMFDSSWRPEFDSNYHQTANITASFDGGEPVEVLLWESDDASANYKPYATNETVAVDLQSPEGAQSVVLTFGLFDAGNDWWWAIDNVVVSGSPAAAPAPLLVEDFESYEAGIDLHGVNNWEGWEGTAGAGAPVSDTFAVSGLNSVEIIGSADLVKILDITGGTVTLSALQYIPAGGSGDTFFILMNQYAPNPLDWSSQTKFSLGSGQINDGLATIVTDEWVELKYVIDLDNNTVDEYYNGELYNSGEWDGDAHNTLQAIDLYSAGASSVYYDDIVID